MENISLSVITVGSKELAILISRLNDMLIHSNQARTSIGIWGHSYWDIYLASLKSGNEMQIIGF